MTMRMIGLVATAALIWAPTLVSHRADASQEKLKETCQSKQSKQSYASGFGKTKEVAVHTCFARLQANAAALYGSSAHLKEKIPSSTGLGEKCSLLPQGLWQCQCSAALCGYVTISSKAPGTSPTFGFSSGSSTKSLLVPRLPPPSRGSAPADLRRR